MFWAKKNEDIGSICACGDTDDACSQSSCPHCSPIKSNFDLEHALNVQTKHEPVEDQKSGTRASLHNSIYQQTIELHRPSSEPYTAGLNAESEILRSVHESELYLQHCMSASPYQMGADGKPLAFATIIKSILFPSKYRNKNTVNNPPSWFRCHLRTWGLFLTCRFPPQAFVVYSHLRQTRLLDPLNGPFQLYAAVSYKCASGRELPKWPSVSLASSLMVVAPATPNKIWLGWYYALLDLAIHIIVILQLELTLRWNHVSGLSGLWTSVGQLIPFIIGVGGLTLIGSRWGVRVWVKWKRNAGMSSGWEKDDLLDETEAMITQCDETFGLGHSVRKGYARWKDLHLAS